MPLTRGKIREKNRQSRDDVLLQYREAIFASVIAIMVEAGNYFFFEHSAGGSQIALTVAIVGILLALLRTALQLSLKESLEPVAKMAEIIDLQTNANISSIQNLLQRYLSVTEPEFRELKDQIVSEAAEQLRRLAIEKRSDTLLTGDYYDWIFRQFDSLKRGDYVHAISLSSETEWNDSQLEKNFLDKNLNAAERGVTINRIFVVKEEALEAFLKLPPIERHTIEAETGLNGFYVSHDALERYDRRYLTAIGEGLLDFNGHVGLEDRFDPDGQARGEVTMLQSDLDKMATVYERLLNMAQPLSKTLVAANRKSTTAAN